MEWVCLLVGLGLEALSSPRMQVRGNNGVMEHVVRSHLATLNHYQVQYKGSIKFFLFLFF